MEDSNADNRKKIKKKYSEQGAGAFDDHQLLEMLLFYSFSGEDTGLFAKKLFDKFGSLDNLFNADPEQIALPGTAEEESARLIKLTADIGRRALSGKENLRAAKSIEDATEYFKRLLENEPEENFAVMLLDGGNKVKYSGIISEGTVNATNVTMMRLTQLVLDNGAKALIIAHNHPNGIARPSVADVNTTISIRDFMKRLGVTLIDHIIIGADSVYSMRSDPDRSHYFSR